MQVEGGKRTFSESSAKMLREAGGKSRVSGNPVPTGIHTPYRDTAERESEVGGKLVKCRGPIPRKEASLGIGPSKDEGMLFPTGGPKRDRCYSTRKGLARQVRITLTGRRMGTRVGHLIADRSKKHLLEQPITKD